MAITRDGAVAWMYGFAEQVSEHRQELVRLDTAIGDGDHGTNLDRGTRKSLEKLDASEPADPGAVLKTVAMTLVSSVGGAAGPLYGTLLLQMATSMSGAAEVDLPGFALACRKGLEGVQSRGKAQPGDKTMVDALVPAVEGWKEPRSSLPDSARRRRRPSRGCTRRLRSLLARVAPATWASAARITWDVTAGLLLVREAGGMVYDYDYDGSGHDPASRNTLAFVPSLAGPLRSIVAEAM